MNSGLSANRAFYLLFATSFAALFLLIGLLLKITPLTISHTIYFCRQTIQGISFSLPHSLPSLLGMFFTLVLSIGFLLLIFQILKTQIFLKNILKYKVNTPKRVNNIANQLGIMGRIDVVKTIKSSSFCYGLIHPRICLNSKMIKNLSDGELKAILVHESYHLVNKDPLKILFSQIAISMFFFVPILRDIHHFYTISKEINADQLVIKKGDLNNLRSALSKALNNFSPAFYDVAFFAAVYGIEKRFLILANPAAEVKFYISPTKLLLSIIFFTFVLVFLNLPVHAMENGDGSHSYVFMSTEDPQMVSCFTENEISELPFSSQMSTSIPNYSSAH